jgi:hypothetical protein
MLICAVAVVHHFETSGWSGFGLCSATNEDAMGAGYWFRAKRYGWGWGLPLTWQGWAALAAFVASVVADGWVFPPRRALPAFIGCVAGSTLLLVAVCWLKGEPPRWRWGDDDPPGP